VAFSFEPGPIDLGSFPLGPRVISPGVFGTLGDDGVAPLAGGDTYLVGIAGAVAPSNPPDFDQVYQATAQPGEEAHGVETGAPYVSPAGDLVDAGDNADGYRQQALRYLPPPSAEPVPDSAAPPHPSSVRPELPDPNTNPVSSS